MRCYTLGHSELLDGIDLSRVPHLRHAHVLDTAHQVRVSRRGEVVTVSSIDGADDDPRVLLACAVPTGSRGSFAGWGRPYWGQAVEVCSAPVACALNRRLSAGYEGLWILEPGAALAIGGGSWATTMVVEHIAGTSSPSMASLTQWRATRLPRLVDGASQETLERLIAELDRWGHRPQRDVVVALRASREVVL